MTVGMYSHADRFLYLIAAFAAINTVITLIAVTTVARIRVATTLK
ncbi:hypothetical protein HNR39_003642 [Glaciimonas immobilis]|uniref:Uncharacterized protein n=1 Tax=Glaciimonas immobilis TaxID=728004 RepID=A0A840RYR3_9BURK|nr:hypothetical protein [Glaciimonas immobilis]